MNEDSRYEKLLGEYRDLQLRVTRFSAIEQELINTRDRLDQELELYKRKQQYSLKSLTVKSQKELLGLIAEGIVDIIETEWAAVFLNNLENPEGSLLVSEGLARAESSTDWIAEMLELARPVGVRQAKVFDSSETAGTGVFSRQADLLIIKYREQDLNYELYFVAGISHAKKGNYNNIAERHRNLFTLFTNQMQSVFANIWRSEKMEEQLQQISRSQQELKKLSLIATKTKSGVIIADAHGRIEWVNEAFAKISGYSPEEVMGRKPKEFLQGNETGEAEKQLLSQALRNKEDIEITVVNHNKSGDLYYNQLEIASVFDDRGNHTNFVAIQKDITDEIRFKQEIIKINSRFELIANFSKIGIWEHDTTTNTVNWNHVMFQISGLGAEKEKGDYIGLWKENIHPEDRNRILEEITALRHNRESHVQQEFRAYRHTDHSLRIIQALTIAERDAKGMLIRLVGSLRDITELKQLQSRLETAIAERDNSLQTVLEKNEELSKINLELDNFVYSISHDLRSPLLSIKGILSLILSSPELSAEQIKLINMCLSSASRLDTTIQEILEYSRNSRMDVTLEEVDVAEMAHNIFNDLRFASDKDIVLNIEAPENPRIRTDRLRLGVLLKNIIGNSIKYRREGIQTIIGVSVDISEDRAMISVKDNGEGIAPRHLSRVFDMFYRGTTSSIGTGLGLYICKEIAGKLGGDLSIESQPGAGTTVHISLPKGRQAGHLEDATLKK